MSLMLLPSVRFVRTTLRAGRHLIFLALVFSRLGAQAALITSQPANVSVTFPTPLPTENFSESAFAGLYVAFTPVPGPYPEAYPNQLDILFSTSGNGYLGLGTTGPWYYYPAANGAAGLRFYVWEDGGRQKFYREYILKTDGTYKTFVLNQSDSRVLYQAGTYQLFDYEGPRSRSEVTFSVAAEGVEAAEFQWYFDGLPIQNSITSPFIYYYESIIPAGRTHITRAQTASLSISNVTRLNAGRYHCVITGSSGSVTSSVATLTVNGHASRDLTPPTVEITIPTTNELRGRDTILVTFISGAAKDETGVGSVFWLFGTNHYGPINIGPAGNSMRDTLWGANLYLEPGTNVLRAYAIDVYGNPSQTNSRTFYYNTNAGPDVTLRLSIEGGGTVTPLTNGQTLLDGQTYQLDARPADGYRFDRWSGTIESLRTGILFVAAEGQSFTAHFTRITPSPSPSSPVPRPGVMTFDELTNSTYHLPILGPVENNPSRMMITGPSAALASGWNPNNGTPALRLNSSVSSNYVIALFGPPAPFELKSFNVVSVAGTFTLADANTGARYEHDGSTGRVNLGRTFRRVRYVEISVSGELVIDNLEYRLVERPPVASVRVWNELDLPSTEVFGNRLFNEGLPSHLDNADYQYPGYQRFWHYVVATGTNPVPFVIDASRSRDPDRNALKFRWQHYTGGNEGEFTPLNGGVASASPYFKNEPAMFGNSRRYEFALTVEDDYHADHLWFGVMVVTPHDIVREVRGWMSEHFEIGDDPSGIVATRLIPILDEVETEILAGRTQQWQQRLKEFRQLVNVHLRGTAPEATKVTLVLVDALVGGAEPQRRRPRLPGPRGW